MSLSIMAIVLIAVFKLQAQSITMNNAARFHTVAPLLMQNILADIKSAPLEDLGPDAGEFGEEYPGYSWQVSVEAVESEDLGDAAERLKALNLKVVFGDEQYQYALTVYHFFE